MVPQIRQPAPAFCLNGAQGVDTLSNVTLEQYKGKWVILLFYPMDWTFVCPTEILAFNDARERLQKLNTEVVCISGDSPYTHLAWLQAPREQGGLGGSVEIPLLSDVTRDVMKQYGVYNAPAIAKYVAEYEVVNEPLEGCFWWTPRAAFATFT